MRRSFAQDTSVPIGRTRAEIDNLLRSWGCDGLSWTDDILNRRVILRFLWTHDVARYVARLTMRFPSVGDIRAAHDADEKKKHGWVRHKLDDAAAAARSDQVVRAGHRVLLLWIKAALNAVTSGLLKAEEVFLPYLEGRDGRTVAEVALPRMGDLLTGDADRLLGAPKP